MLCRTPADEKRVGERSVDDHEGPGATGVRPSAQVALAELRHRHRPDGDPAEHLLRGAHGEVVRLHSLPGLERCSEDESEYLVVPERHDTVPDEPFAGVDVYVNSSAGDDGTRSSRLCA